MTRPAGEPLRDFKELFAAGKRADEVLARQDGEVLDIFARLQFSPVDSPWSRARFFGEYVYLEPEPEDLYPSIEYRHAEGRVLLLLSKFADDTGTSVRSAD